MILLYCFLMLILIKPCRIDTHLTIDMTPKLIGSINNIFDIFLHKYLIEILPTNFLILQSARLTVLPAFGS